MKKLVVPLVVLVVILASTLGCGTSGGSRTATERISADDGGSVTSTDGALTLEIPPGALAENTRISIREVDPDDLPDEFAEVGEGMGYELEPEGLVFTEPVTVSLSLDPESLEAEGGDGYEVFALLSWSEANGVEPLDAMVLEISAAEGEATLLGELDHFSFIRRIKSGLEVSLEEVNREQPVGGRFSALLHIVNISDGVNPVFSDVHGAFHAYGTVGLNGSGDFTVAGEMGKDHFDFESGNFLCKDTPGIGSYGVQVHALYTSGGAQTRASRQVSIVLDSVVECVAPPPETPEPVSEAQDIVENMLLKMGYTPEQVTQLRIARVLDPNGDWIYSILGVTPGQVREWIDLMTSLGVLSETDRAALNFWFNQSLFECGELVDGQLTVCSVSAGDFPEGNMFIFAALFDGEVPLDDPDTYYTYSVVMDGDGDPSNNFQFMPPYNWDFYQGTDRWYVLDWNPELDAWALSLIGENFTQLHTDARAVISENAVIFFIPASEVEVERPAYRITSFGHDGTFSPEASGGDVTGDDPTQPLLEITGDVLQVP